jgi:hypothetical protein
MTNTPYRQHLSPQSANTGLLLRIRDSSRCSERAKPRERKIKVSFIAASGFCWLFFCQNRLRASVTGITFGSVLSPYLWIGLPAQSTVIRTREARTLTDHLYQTSLTVVLRQKRQVVTPITPKNQDRSYVPTSGGLDYAEVYDVKDHHGFGAASNRINCRNDRRFC